jgi:acylphosphatase
MSGSVRARLTIRGRVQGVAYRMSAQTEGLRLGLLGTVRNLPDGSVEAVAEGPRKAVEDFIRWCKRGPPAARVEEVQVDWSDALGDLDDFDIGH